MLRPSKNYLDIWSYSTDEILDMVELIRELKTLAYKREVPRLLDGQTLAMIFNGNSTRTRVSFETAMTQLGGHAEYLTGGEHGELHLGKRETVADTSRVIASMTDGISMRWFDFRDLEEFARVSTVPVFNMMDSYRHPTQTLCDLTTIIENLPEGKTLADIKLVFVGSDTISESSAGDLAKLLPRFGATIVMCSPENHGLREKLCREMNPFEPDWLLSNTLELRERACAEGGGTIIETHDWQEAVKDADFIYTGCFCYEGMESESDFEYFQRVFLDAGFQVNKNMLSLAPNAKTMHYLPALRGKEMDDYAMDFEGSLLWTQAENRLHTQRGLLAYLMGSRTLDEFAPRRAGDEKVADMIERMYQTYGPEYTHC